MLPSFAQRWLLPRLSSWQARHPQITLEVHASQQLVDLHQEGFHAGLRVGRGAWKGVQAERLIDSPLIAVAAPELQDWAPLRALRQWMHDELERSHAELASATG